MFEIFVPDRMAEFALASVLVEITPGPNMAWLAVIAATRGRGPGLLAVAGVATGLAIVGIAAAFGLAALVSASPLLYQVLRWGGVIWLVYLALEAWRGEAESENSTSHRTWFGRGLMTNLLNPKAYLFYLAMLPGFVDPGHEVLPQTLLLSAVYVAVATAIHGTIVLAAGQMTRLLGDPAKSRVLGRISAVILLGVAVWFAIATASPKA